MYDMSLKAIIHNPIYFLLILNIVFNVSFSKSYSSTVQIMKNYEAISDDYYFDKNLQPNDNFLKLVSSQKNNYVKAVLFSAFEFAAQSKKIGYDFGGNFTPETNGVKLSPKTNSKNVMTGWSTDCSGLIYYIFNHSNQFLKSVFSEQNNDLEEKLPKIETERFSTYEMVNGIKTLDPPIHQYYKNVPKEDFKTNSKSEKVFRPQSGDLPSYI